MADVFLKFRYEERDVRSALRLRLRGSGRRRLELLLAGIAALTLILSYELAGSTERAILSAVIALLALVVAIVVAARALPGMVFRRRPDLHRPMGVDASEEGLTITSGDRASTVRWAEVARVEYDDRICALHYGTKILLVPRRIFRSPRQERAFFDLIERHASREKRRLDSGKSTPSAAP
jgi:YcxB-like protein